MIPEGGHSLLRNLVNLENCIREVSSFLLGEESSSATHLAFHPTRIYESWPNPFI